MIRKCYRWCVEQWHAMPPFGRGLLLGLGAMLALVMLTGCSGASSEIARNAQRTQANAGQIVAETQTIKAANQAVREDQSPANIESQTAQSDKSADNIQALASTVATDARSTGIAVTRVKDITPWWAVVLERLAFAVAGVVLFMLLWRSGVLGFVRSWIGILSPKIKSEAKLTHEALTLVRQSDDPQAINATESAVAVRRAQSPEFDAAYRKVGAK